MDRPTTTLHLPVSNFDVQLVTYLTKGEDDAVNAAGLEGAEVVFEIDPKTGRELPKLVNVSTQRYRREVAKIIELGVHAASLEGKDVPVDTNFVNNLPMADVDLLADKLIAVRSVTGDPKAATNTAPISPDSSQEN